MSDVPFIVAWQEWVAEAQWRRLVRIGAITPRRARSDSRPLIVIGDTAKGGRANPVLLRRLRDTLKAVGVKHGKGRKKDLQLLYDLAVWQSGRDGASIPKRSLRGHMDDLLWGILQNHGEVSFDCAGFAYLPREELDKLEKRLNQRWSDVEKIANAFHMPTRHASNYRRKPKKSFVAVLLQPPRLTNS